MKRSVHAISSSPWAGERERSTLSSLAAVSSASCSRSLASEHRIEQALAHSERGNHDFLRTRDPHHVLEHERCIGEKRTPGVGHHLDARERLGIDTMHETGKIERLFRRHHIAMHDVQRVAGLPHVQARQRPPCSADRIERAALAAFQDASILERRPDDLFRLLDRLRRDVLQREAAERQCHARLHPVAVDFGRARASPRRDRRRSRPACGIRTPHRAPTVPPRACRRGRRSLSGRCAPPPQQRICRSWRHGRRRLQSPRAERHRAGRKGRGSAAAPRMPSRPHRPATNPLSAPRVQARRAPSR